VQVASLQGVVAKLEHERGSMHRELLQTLAQCASLQQQLDDSAAAMAEQERLQQQVDLAMEMIGERNSRVRRLVSSAGPVFLDWCCGSGT
jgi:membrane carboxypeptidase/penicillin-binding protein PbpC